MLFVFYRPKKAPPNFYIRARESLKDPKPKRVPLKVPASKLPPVKVEVASIGLKEEEEKAEEVEADGEGIEIFYESTTFLGKKSALRRTHVCPH